MKRMTLSLLVLVLALTLPMGSVFAKAPDIVIDSKLDFDWTGFLINNMRKLLRNNGLPDPFTQKIIEPIVVTDDVIESYLDADAKDLINNLGNLIGLDLLKGKTKVVLHGIDYDIRDFKTNLRANEKAADGITIDLDFAASKLNLRADKVTLSLIIPSKDPKKSASIDIQLIRPVIRASGDKLINFFAKIKIQDNNEHFKFLVTEANFDQLAEALLANPKGVYMNFRDIEIPDVAIRIGNRRLAFDEAKIKNLLNDRQQAIKTLLIAQLASQLKKGMGTTILKVIEQYSIEKDMWINSSTLVSNIKFDKFTSDLSRNNLEINMPADFCTPEKFKVFKNNCVNNKVTKPMPSRIDGKTDKASVQVIKDLIDNGHANLVASISEDYVNKLLVATYDAGLWEDMLKENDVILGPNKMMLVMEEKGDQATLILDLLNRPKKIEGIVVGAKEIRFPLVLKSSVRIENKNGIPNIIVRINDVDTSDSTLKNGRPELGAVSNIRKLRLKKMILQTIREKVKSLPGSDVLTLPYPELKGLGLENVDFESDGMGRMNAILRLKNVQ